MRDLVPRRIIGLGILLAVLCLAPAISPPAYSKPISWEDKEDPNAPPTKGDGDGTVVKVTSGRYAPNVSNMTVARGTRTSVSSMVSSALRLVSMGYGVRWYL